MSLATGTRLGTYEIRGALGAGGMGEVYRARDTRLDREVAVKILPEVFALDPDRLMRFEREARTLASLNHPNIAQIYGIEESPSTGSGQGRVRALAMELVEGEDLAARIAHGALPLDEALPIARQVAEALEAAHEAGIIHRDLKPANIKVRADGTVKVLDFGLAKARDHGTGSSPDAAHSPTFTSPALTELGVILGTAAYMAPEQARGKAVDRRADIWAFGCVLFEMLTGRQPFAGETISDVMAAVLTNDPDWSQLPAGTPAVVRRLLRRCLERDPKRRLRDVGEARLQLEDVHAEPDALEPRASRRPGVLAAVAAAGILVGGLGGWMLTRTSAAPPPPSRFGLELPLLVDASQSLALSPDGRMLAFRGRGDDGVTRLYVRALDTLEPRPLRGTEGGRLPFFSADGRQVAYFSGAQVKRVMLSGGDPQVLADGIGLSLGGTWADDGAVIVADGALGLVRIPPGGGAFERLVEAGVGEVATPWALPNGRGVLFSQRQGDRFDVKILSLPDRAVHLVAESGWGPAWVSSGHVLFQQGDTISAVPLDPRRLVPAGTPSPVAMGLGIRISRQTRMFAAADDGTLVYIPNLAGAGAPWTIAWVDRAGRETPLTEIAEAVDTVRLSPDGSRVAFRKPAPNCEIWSYDLTRGTSTRLTFEGDNHGVVWSPDGDEILSASVSETSVLIAVPADGRGTIRPLNGGAILAQSWPTSWSGPGRAVVAGQGTALSFFAMPEGVRTGVIEGAFSYSQGVLSPDGRLLAFTSDQGGPSQVYVQGYPDPGRRVQVSTAGGAEPVWSRDGRELFFRQGRALLVVDVDPATGRPGARPRELFTTDHLPGAWAANYDVSPDGARFLMVRGPAPTSTGNVVVALNWLSTWASPAR